MDSVIHGFFLVESLVLVSFIPAFSGKLLVSGNLGGHHFPGASTVIQHNDVPFWHENSPDERGPFPELEDWQSLGVTEAGMQGELEDALSRKGYDMTEIDESFNEIDDGRKELPAFEAAPKYDPGTQMAGNPFPHPTSSAQNARRLSIKDNNNILGLSDGEHEQCSSSVTAGKDQLVSKLIHTYPFQFHKPERNWYSYSGQPSLTASLFPEPVFKHLLKSLKEQKYGDPTANPLFWIPFLDEQILTFANVRNDIFLPGKLFREQLCALLRKQLFLGVPGATNFRFASGEGDWVSKHENLHHPERKSFYKSVLLPQLVTSILAEVSGEGIENGKPTQETLAQNDIGNHPTWMLDGQAEFLKRFPQAQTYDVHENASVSKYENWYHPERKTVNVVYESKLPLRLRNCSFTEVTDVDIENNEPVQEPLSEDTGIQIEIRRFRGGKKHCKHSKHSKGPRKVTVYVEGDVDVTTAHYGSDFILSVPLYETKSKEKSKSARGFSGSMNEA